MASWYRRPCWWDTQSMFMNKWGLVFKLFSVWLFSNSSKVVCCSWLSRCIFSNKFQRNQELGMESIGKKIIQHKQKPRRSRACFTHHQLLELERRFSIQRYLQLLNSKYHTRAIITRSWFQITLDYKLRNLLNNILV